MVMVSDLHVLMLRLYNIFSIQEMRTHILNLYVQIKNFDDSKTVFYLVSKDAKTSQRQLQSDIYAMRNS